MAQTKQTARVQITAKGQGTSAIGADHQSIGQLLAKLPDSSKSSTDFVSALAESMDPTGQLAPDQMQPVKTTQISQPYGGLTQDSRQKWK